MGSPDHNFFTACTDVKNYMTDSMRFSIEAIEGNLTNKQKMTIWNKYGISPMLARIIRNRDVIEDEEIVMNFKDSVSPCIIKPLKGEKYTYLVLPIRIN